MVDISLEALKEIAEVAPEASEKLKNTAEVYDNFRKMLADRAPTRSFREGMESANQKLERVKRGFDSGQEGIKGFMASLGNLSRSNIGEFFEGLDKKIRKKIETAGEANQEMTNLAGTLISFAGAATGKLQISDELNKMGEASQEATSQLGQVYTRISGIIPGGEALNKRLEEVGFNLENVFKQTDIVRNMEISLLRTSTAAGNLDEVMGSLEGDITNLPNKILQFTNEMTDLANANNISFDSAVKLSNIMREIPGAMDAMVSTSQDGTEQMDMMNAVLKVSHGTFQSTEDVMGDVRMMFENFNIVGTDSLELVTRMHAAAQELNMPMENMRGFVSQAAESFRFLGDNTQAAINIMGRFGPALRDAGVGPRGIQDIVSNMVNVVSQLDVAQRAFVSARSGGVGGLQGGYELAYQMQEGGLDEVFSQVETTLRDMMGGQLVTLEEASQSRQAAAQMTRQVQMLTTGPLAIAGSEQEAFRIVEAMSRGEGPEGIDIGGPEATLDEAVQQGNQIQEHQLDALNNVRNELERQTVIAGLSLDVWRKQLTGAESALGRNIALREEAMQATRERDIIGAEPTTSVGQEFTRTRERLEQLEQTAFETVKSFPVVGDLLGDREREEERARAKTRAEISEGARTMEEKKRGQAEARPRGTPGEDNSIIIKVMSEDKIERMIKVFLGENNKIIGHQEMKSSYGQGMPR